MKPLVFDIGMFDGEDTAYYLHQGYRVVAVEARPDAVEKAHNRFAEAIEAGNLTILNVGIANDPGTATFWVCEPHPEWSSFHREIASRLDSPHRPIEVPCVRFSDILNDYDQPYFVKIDIEGNDQLCLDALTPHNAPLGISFEMGHNAGVVSIASLYQVGYRRFRCVRQNDFRVVEPKSVVRYQLALESGLPERLSRKMFFQVQSPQPSRCGYLNAFGSSGPFGDDLSGRWLNLAEISMVWSHLSALNARWPSLDYWYDIHAVLGGEQS